MNELQKKIMQLVYSGNLESENGAKLYNELVDLCPTDAKQKLMEIAVVGISGIFPHAKNVKEFWENLVEGRDCIDEIDKRWDNLAYYYSPKDDDNLKSYSKWGGLLESIYNFDPAFFELSPRQAELMEPRQRLLLMEIWKTFEDAGFSKQDLDNSSCGVFIGCEGSTDYFKDMDRTAMNGYAVLGHSNAILSARASYFLNLKGPNLTIDTACSSSLVAVHTACRSIIAGECEFAIAGGTTIMTEPYSYPLLCNMGMLSHDGRCKSFDEKADGFVPSECVATVLLMPLKKAIEENCHIYGVIQASGINYDGKTNGITAPSVSSQLELEKNVYKKYGIDPATISYVEAHGTGTKLGDPIEVHALTQAFGNAKEKGQYCGIGSVKTNIGHTAATSGVASLIKVLLAMDNNLLPKTLHYNNCNSRIDLKNSPFYIVDSNKKWTHSKNDFKRAAISSFGYSGTNCHLVVDSYEKPLRQVKDNDEGVYFLFPFSGRTKEALFEYITKFVEFLEDNSLEKCSLEILSYNLLICRTHFEYRICIIANEYQDLKKYLLKALESREDVSFISKKQVSDLENVHFDISRDKLFDFDYMLKLKNYFLSGNNNISWHLLYKCKQRVSLPCYCFSNREYTIQKQPEKNLTENKCDSFKLYNEIGQKEDRVYSKTISKKDFFIRDHNFMLPGVVMIEMVLQCAMSNALNAQVCRMENIVWRYPIFLIDDELVLTIKEKIISQNITKFFISTNQNGNEIVHFQATVIYGIENGSAIYLDTEEIVKKCKGGSKEASYFYECLNNLGIGNGAGLRGMKALFYNENEICARLEIPDRYNNTQDTFKIHPTLMDGGLHPIVGWLYLKYGVKDNVYLPFSASDICIYDLSVNPNFVYITINHEMKNGDVQTQSYNVNYVDKKGKVLFTINNYSCREFVPENIFGKFSDLETNNIILYEEKWVKCDIQHMENDNKNWVIFSHNSDNLAWEKQDKIILVKNGLEYKRINNYIYENNFSDLDSYKFLIHTVTENMKKGVNYLFDLTCSSYNFDERLKYGIFSIFKLVQALMMLGNNTDTKILVICDGQDEYKAINGFAKVLRMEKPQYSLCIVSSINSISSTEIFNYEKNSNIDDTEVLYLNNIRYKKILKEISKPNILRQKLKYRGKYLISGGAGGLGIIFAKYLATNYHADVFIIGRSELDQDKRKMIDSNINSKGKICYLKCDVSDRNSVKKLSTYFKCNKIDLNGIIHAAGIIRDSMIITKKVETFKEVIAPKVLGIKNLLENFNLESLDFILMFSSTASVLGSFGQCDYAFANSYLDNLAYNGKIDKKKLITINWPYWQNGGMYIEPQKLEITEKNLGVTPLLTEEGIKVFEFALKAQNRQIVAVSGNIEKIRRKIMEVQNPNLLKSPELCDEEQNNLISVGFSDSCVESQYKEEKKLSQNDFKKCVINIIKDILKSDYDIEEYEKISDFGFDSIMFTELSNKLNETFKLNINPAEFFGFSYLSEIMEYLYESYLNNTFVGETQKLVEVDEKVSAYQDEPKEMLVEKREEQIEEDMRYNPIAIIGISGVMPGSKNLEEFWNKIKENEDFISEIPKERWQWEDYYGKPTADNYCTNIKWGSFIEDYDKFDPLFFNIAGFDTELMDPQERLILENIWKTIEDAGYASKAFWGTNTGVFIGVSSADYKELLLENKYPTMLTQTFIPNRVSYVFNLHGPSEPIDTACSSSLVAIHKAIQSIHNGECEMAFAGAVNLMLSPNLFITESKTNVLSQDGKCKTFDKAADGYVRGEGIVTMLLKPLNRAVADNDHIYGFIRGSAINHGGRANNLFSPNAKAQAEVIVKAMEKSKIDPQTISYIETHGTGTSLGDPIEIEGLKEAYQYLYKSYGHSYSDKKVTGLGSIKTNIGHLEAASGMAGILKILFSLRDNIIPATINLKEINPYIDLKNTPFYITDSNQIWDFSENKIPRRAAISSFGVGGVNAHLIIEEYCAEVSNLNGIQNQQNVIPVSAKTPKALKNYVTQLKKFVDNICERNNYEEIVNYICCLIDMNKTELNVSDTFEDLGFTSYMLEELIQKFQLSDKQICLQDTVEIFLKSKQDKINIEIHNIAYTLQEGRDEFKYRVAFIAENIKELTRLLEIFIEKDEAEYPNTIITEQSIRSSSYRQTLNNMEKDNQLMNMAIFWVKGNHVEWGKLYKAPIKKISIPGYPFEKERYWFKEKNRVFHPAINYDKEKVIQENVINTEETMSLKIIKDRISKICSKLLKISNNKIHEDELFSAYGMDSIRFVDFTKTINKSLDTKLEVFEVIECQNISKLAEHIFREKSENRMNVSIPLESFDYEKNKNEVSSADCIITLISCSKEFKVKRFEEFWVNLKKESYTLSSINNISNSTRLSLIEQGKIYQHVLVKNKMGNQVETFIAGKGQIVLIITGIGVAPCFSKYQIEELSKFYQVIVFSMPGIGLSSEIGELSLEHLSAHIMSTLDALEIEGKIRIIGISWGALLASMIAANYSERVDKIVLGSPIANMQMSFKENDDLTKVDEEVKVDFMNVSGGEQGYDLFLKSKCINPKSYAAYAAYFGKKAPKPHSIEGILPYIKCKTLIIHGKQDKINSLEESVYIANRIQNSFLIEMDDCSHLPMVTHPQEFNNTILDFFNNQNDK